MKKRFPSLVFVVLVSTATFAGEADLGLLSPQPSPNLFIKPSQVIWEEEDDNGNFRIDQYTARGSRILTTSRQKLYMVLTDYENYDKWMPYFKSTQKTDSEHLAVVFTTKNFGDYTITLKIEYPRRNMNGYYHWLRLTTETEFPFSTLKAIEHNFYLYQVKNITTDTIDEGYTLLEISNHTKIGGLLTTMPEAKMKEILIKVAEQLFENLQTRLNSIEEPQ
ncbi:MAG: SRPBCC family protein [Deltaproteobacteria bacterium]|nr:SRPBCC family protein [Deltaproteobacteria bacterium]